MAQISYLVGFFNLPISLNEVFSGHVQVRVETLDLAFVKEEDHEVEE